MDRKRKTDKLAGFVKEWFTTILTLGSVLVGVVVWFYTMNGIPARLDTVELEIKKLKQMENVPPRVDKLEQEVNDIKEQLIENNTKTDLILKETILIRTQMFEQHARR